MKPKCVALLLVCASLIAVGCRQSAEIDEAEMVARRWIELYNDGTPTFYGSDRVLDLYAEDCVWTESPTKMYPAGRKGSLAQLRSALSMGQSVLVDRHVVLHDVVANGSAGAMRYSFSAKVSGDIPSYSKGSRIALEVAAFFKVRQGRIAEIHELIVELT